MNEGNENLANEVKTLVEHLAAQYKLYREEVRLYIGFAATSSTLLVLLLFSVFNAARGTTPPNLQLYILIPVSLVWYSAILSLFICHVVVIEEYSELIERKMNTLLRHDMFQFESSYKFPSLHATGWKILTTWRGGGEVRTFLFFVFLIGVIPLYLSLYAGYKAIAEGFHSTGWAWTFVGVCITVIGSESCLVYRTRILKQRKNQELLDNWKNELKELGLPLKD